MSKYGEIHPERPMLEPIARIDLPVSRAHIDLPVRDLDTDWAPRRPIRRAKSKQSRKIIRGITPDEFQNMMARYRQKAQESINGGKFAGTTFTTPISHKTLDDAQLNATTDTGHLKSS